MKRARTVVNRLDGWAHFHRFHLRLLCDLHDWANGIPWGQVRKSTKDGDQAHRKMQSFRSHPSQRECVDG